MVASHLCKRRLAVTISVVFLPVHTHTNTVGASQPATGGHKDILHLYMPISSSCFIKTQTLLLGNCSLFGTFSAKIQL